MEYYITEMGNLPSKFFNIDKPIMVKVIPSDLIDYYLNNQRDIDYDENIRDNERWLVFQNYPGKISWLKDKEWACENDDYWDIDFEDFIPHMMSIKEFSTGESFMRCMYEVIMVNQNLDVIEAKEQGLDINTKTGSQHLLESLDLDTFGEGEDEYCIVSIDKEKKIVYAISCVSPERDAAGNFHVDALYCLRRSPDDDSWCVIKTEKFVGIYNYLTRQVFKFADR